ncbi:PEP-CTERM system TPR-repeat protein PrsT [Endozoicomonas sp. G2_1]|uniref:XrtA/PEP-CTERM system TPR-repeat protein PrsT n=1 Tax=Endozoicomonas sp. G2_1 TaxID=2821091 RepID=UPI001ADD4921|nr:XrtA/PEP-CTERM system TPR-repeat protein PrsT [Endozoicomonas sp. G2_1]MBO9490274.1 PEP-CTERM system TPR-repeat protein PrsT [Endozoicomonas sp. G2_1]
MRYLLCCFISFYSCLALANSDYEKALTAFNNQKVDEAYIHLKNALNSQPDNLPAKLLMGKILIEEGFYDDGISVLEEAGMQGADINLYLRELAAALLITNDFDKLLAIKESSKLSIENQLNLILYKGNAYVAIENIEQARIEYNKAYRLAPLDIRAISSLANFELSQQHFTEVEKILNSAGQKLPAHSHIWYLKGQLAKQMGKQSLALKHYRSAMELSGEDPIIQRALAYQYSLLGYLAEAQELLEKILKDTPDDPFVNLLKSQVLKDSAQESEALEVLSQVSDKLSQLSDQQRAEDMTLIYVTAAAAYLQNNFELAQTNLKQYLKLSPNDLTAISMLSNIYIQQKQFDKAEDLLEQKELAIISDLVLSLKLVDIYLNNNRMFKAEYLLEKLARDFSNDDRFVLMKANVLAKSKRYNDALSLLSNHKPQTNISSYAMTTGLIFITKGDFESAQKVASTLLQENPSSIDFLMLSGLIALKQEQWQQALHLFDKILIQDSSNFSARFNSATAHAALNNTQQALDIVKSLLNDVPDSADAQVLHAKLLRDSGSTEQAILQLKSTQNIDAKNIEVATVLAQIYMNNGNYEEALVELNRLSKLRFLHFSDVADKAFIYIRTNQLSLAQKNVGIAIGVAESAEQFFRLAQLQQQIGDLAGAYNSIQKAAAKQPEHLVYQFEQAQLAIQLNKTSDAQNIIAKLRQKLGNNNANVKVLEGDVLAKSNKKKAAFNKYISAYKLTPYFDKALIKSYQLTLSNIGHKQFSQTLESTLAKQTDLHFSRNLLADFYLNQQQLDKAKGHYLILIEQAEIPNKAFIFNNLANIFINDDITQAEQYAQQALELSDNNTAILDTNGWIATKQGKLEQGLALLRQAYTLNSNDPAVNYHLGYTLNKLARTGEAIKSLQDALDLNVDFAESEQTKSLLEELKKQ